MIKFEKQSSPRCCLSRTRRSPPAKRGITLLVIVVLVMLISLAAYRYTFVMESEYRLTRLQEELVQARLSALSGIEYAAYQLEQPLSRRSKNRLPSNRERVYRRITDPDAETTSDNSPMATNSAATGSRSAAWRFGLISALSEEGVPGDSMSATLSSSSSAINSIGENETIAWQWGLENESAKLSIPTLLQWERTRPGHFRTVLLLLPGVEEETADAWLGELGVRRVGGAASANGPQAIGTDMIAARSNSLQSSALQSEQKSSLERMRSLWFGGDLNQNYRLDPIEVQLLERLSRSERGGTPSPRPATNSETRWRPLQRYLTWTQGERNERRDGSPRIYLNQPNLQQLHQQLTSIMPIDLANFVIAYRQFGPSVNDSNPVKSNTVKTNPGVGNPTKVSAPSTTASETRLGETGKSTTGSSLESQPSEIPITSSEFVPDWNAPARFQLQSPLDLFAVTVDIPSTAGTSTAGVAPGSSSVGGSPSAGKSARSPKKVMKSPFSSDSGEVRNYLEKWLSETTIVEAPVREGRVDITDAPVEVLMGVPGIDAPLAQRIVQQRRSLAATPEALESIAWLLQNGVVDIQKFREIEPFLTHRSDVYSVQSIGFRASPSTLSPSPVYRCTVTIDARQIPASLRNPKVWHPWDRGFSSESLMAASK
ncbi:MAG: helix-hairpin-helix domain-containing protein, partial [Planctomycetes bacterium]|nr:helix-hairpin-helix domain-containing protein [Planctomycetota bacterium]